MIKHRTSQGATLLGSVAILLFLITFSGAVFGLAHNSSRFARRVENKEQSFYLAEAAANTLTQQAKADFMSSGNTSATLASTDLRDANGRLLGSYSGTLQLPNGVPTPPSGGTYDGETHTVAVPIVVQGVGRLPSGQFSTVKQNCEGTITSTHHVEVTYVNTAHFCAPPTYEEVRNEYDTTSYQFGKKQWGQGNSRDESPDEATPAPSRGKTPATTPAATPATSPANAPAPSLPWWQQLLNAIFGP